MPTLYVETSIISYLAAQPSRDLIIAAHQRITHEWWAAEKDKYELFTSEAVRDEIAQGHPDAAQRRLSLAADIPLLDLSKSIDVLSKIYHKTLALPDKASLDCVHLACSVAYGIEYLLTWNCVHLANGRVIRALGELNRNTGRHSPTIVTPEEILQAREED